MRKVRYWLLLKWYIAHLIAGAIDFPLHCAGALDPTDSGLEHWYAGSPPGDPRAEAADRRLKCYDLVLDSLGSFEEKSQEAAPSSSSDDPETVRSHAYDLAFASPDEMFHSTLYTWLIDRGVADELLEVCYELFRKVDMTELVFIDASTIPRGPPQPSACNCPETSTIVAIPGQGWPALTCC